MIIEHPNGNRFSAELSEDAIRGLRIRTVTFDEADINKILSTRNSDTHELFSLMKIAMVGPQINYHLEPIDEVNRQLKREGKNYICQATVKKKSI